MWHYVIKGGQEHAYVLSAHRGLRAALKSLDTYAADVGAYVRRARQSCRRLYAGETIDFATFGMDMENVSDIEIARTRKLMAR